MVAKPASTTLVEDIFSGEDGSNPSSLTVVNHRLFISATDNDLFWELA